MRNWMMLLIVAGGSAGCGQIEPDPTSIQLAELTDAVARDVSRFEGWVAHDQGTAANPFPIGLCLKEISFKVSVSSQRNFGGSIGLPLAAPASPISGMLGLSASSDETTTRKVTVPFFPAYGPRSTTAPANDQEKATALAKWRSELVAEDVPSWADVPAAYTGRDFASDRSLAAELWRLRDVVHRPVYRTALGDGTVYRPETFTFTSEVTLIEKSGGSLQIAMGSGATAALNSSGTNTSRGSVTIQYGLNKSYDPFACDEASLSRGN